jgi:hypothetical protein
MNNRVVEYGACFVSDHSVLGIQRFDGSGLSLNEYQHRLQDSILPDVCRSLPDTAGPIDVIWKDREKLWNLEGGSRDSGEVVALTMEDRTALAHEIAGLVGGTVVSQEC